MKKLIGLVAVALVVMFAASCNKGGEVGPIVEKALNGIISGDYNAFVEACDLGEDSLPEDQVASAKQMTVSMLEKTMKQIKEGTDENAKKNLLKSVKVIEEKVDGDNATVKVECTTEGGETKQSDVTLKKNKKGEINVRTAHSLNRVPFFIVSKDKYEIKDADSEKYGLANVAPTVLKIFGIEAPACWEDSMI